MKGKVPAEELLIGAHTSAQGGVHKALLEAESIGATTAQLFTSNQRRWSAKPIPEEEITRWEKASAKTGLQKIMSHDSYLINLGSPDELMVEKSKKAFAEEIKRCHQLNISYLNFHPGAATKGSEAACLDQIVQSLKSVAELVKEGKTRLLNETTAGQGTTVGWRFEQIGYLIKKLYKNLPIGVCIDTCHIFAAGYDIRTARAWDATLSDFDNAIGLEHLFAFHVNDSMKPLGSRRDRHAQLGEGEIGLECFKVMMQHPQIRELPKYLETPGGPEVWKKEIPLLRKFAK